MADLAADYAGLESFADSLGNAQISFDSSGQTVAAFGGPLGTRSVDDAVSAFIQHWTTGRQTIDSYFDVLIKMVQGSVQTLRQMDKNLGDSAPTGR